VRLPWVTPLVAGVAVVALVAPAPASAHLTPEPSFVAAGSEQQLVLTVHNDRDATMTGFRLTVPEGFRILAAGGEEGWSEAVAGARATWTGGALEPLEPVVFEVDVAVAALEPGTVELRGDQLYADGESVTWPVPLTVVPAGETTTVGFAITRTGIAILAVLGALVVGTFGLVFWQRRRARGSA
jgi:uncharacterized protein YcnI